MEKKLSRSYLSVAKSTHKVLDVLSHHLKPTLKATVEHLIATGLRYEKEAHRRPENAEIFNRRLPEFKYTVRKSERTFLSVSPQVFLKVKYYASKKELTMVEATWRLLSIGMQYTCGGDPRNDPRFRAVKGITELIENDLKKKYGVDIEKFFKAAGNTDLEDRVIDILHSQSMDLMQDRTYRRRRISSSTLNILAAMEAKYMTMLLGAQKIIDDLERKNEVLERKLVQMDKFSE